MQLLTVKDIREKEPCYDPTKYVSEDWQGTLIDIIDLDGPSADDKIWIITQFLSDKTNRLFAVWCAREALKTVENPDPRSIAACDIAERFANGQATIEELAAAWDAARDAARAAVRATARDAA